MNLELGLIVISLSVLTFGLISKRAENFSVTAPMVFVIIGLLGHYFGMAKIDLSHGFIHGFLEVTLILVLFTDASRIKLKLLMKQQNLPLRLLLIGMPVTIIVGGFFAQWMFEFENIWLALLLAAILAPTDAALGQVVVSSKIVPVRIRQTLNVESGVNDGLALPVILVFLALVQASLGHSGDAHAEADVSHWAFFAGKQVILGPLTGIFVSLSGGYIISLAAKTNWMNHTFQDLSVLALSFLAFGLAEMIGGNGFIAAFIAGLTLGNLKAELCDCLIEFAEAQGQLLTLCVFLILGAVILPEFSVASIGMVLLYAILSLTVFRMIPVSLSLIGTKLKPQSHLFLGWFGPRGLASVLFGLLMLEEIHSPTTELLFSIILATVFLSIFLHGITAAPLAKLYSRSLEKKIECAEEHIQIDEMPTRH